MIDSTAFTAIGHLAGVLGFGPVTSVALMGLLPVACTAAVLTWHGLRGTDPGPAAGYLLTLVAMVLPLGGRRRGRRR